MGCEKGDRLLTPVGDRIQHSYSDGSRSRITPSRTGGPLEPFEAKTSEFAKTPHPEAERPCLVREAETIIRSCFEERQVLPRFLQAGDRQDRHHPPPIQRAQCCAKPKGRRAILVHRQDDHAHSGPFAKLDGVYVASCDHRAQPPFHESRLKSPGSPK